MEPQFKSSFIPKKPVMPVSMRQVRTKPVGLLFTLAFIIFIAAALLSGGVFGYGWYLDKEIERKREELTKARSNLQPALVEEIRRLEARLTNAQTLLTNHLALSPVFELLQKSTLVSVQFTNFEYAFNPEGGVTLVLSGVAPNFGSLALQSDVLYRDSVYRGIDFSSVNLDAEGKVVFDLNLDVDGKVASYPNLVLSRGLPATTPTTTPMSTTTPSGAAGTTTGTRTTP